MRCCPSWLSTCTCSFSVLPLSLPSFLTRPLFLSLFLTLPLLGHVVWPLIMKFGYKIVANLATKSSELREPLNVAVTCTKWTLFCIILTRGKPNTRHEKLKRCIYIQGVSERAPYMRLNSTLVCRLFLWSMHQYSKHQAGIYSHTRKCIRM